MQVKEIMKQRRDIKIMKLNTFETNQSSFNPRKSIRNIESLTA